LIYQKSIKMKSRKQYLKEIATLCAEIGPEDGINPRTLFHKSARKKTDRKAYQVCKQAAKTLNMVMSLEPLLRELRVGSVEPDPDSSHLLVYVEPSTPHQLLDEHQVLEALQRARGHLRSAVATAINRKRAPQLSFRITPEVAQ
jgi:ribosome-binding factor A